MICVLVFFAIGVAQVLGDDSFDLFYFGFGEHTSRIGRGSSKRFTPNGGAANGTPRNRAVSPSSEPRTAPAEVRTTTLPREVRAGITGRRACASTPSCRRGRFASGQAFVDRLDQPGRVGAVEHPVLDVAEAEPEPRIGEGVDAADASMAEAAPPAAE